MANRKEYTTKTRVEILNYLKNNKEKAVSALDILMYIRKAGSTANQTTVYRYLERLYNQQIITKYFDNNGLKSVYQYIGEKEDSQDEIHLKCMKCGKIMNVDCNFLTEFANHLQSEHNFNIQSKGNLLYGVCDDCNKKK